MISHVEYATDFFNGLRHTALSGRNPHATLRGSTARLAPSHLEPEQSPLVHMAMPFLDSMA